MPPILFYIHDPMCAWCWGFQPVWRSIEDQLSNKLTIRYVMGGLAPDTDQPMPQELQEYIESAWRRIQETIPGTQFNFDFWKNGRPRRSTYPACRAVLAATQQNEINEKPMIRAIQEAYYLNAQNPSDDKVLISLAETLGLDTEQFSADLNSDQTQIALAKNIQLFQQLSAATGIRGFPSLVVYENNQYQLVPQDYNSAEPTLDFLSELKVIG